MTTRVAIVIKLLLLLFARLQRPSRKFYVRHSARHRSTPHTAPPKDKKKREDRNMPTTTKIIEEKTADVSTPRRRPTAQRRRGSPGEVPKHEMKKKVRAAPRTSSKARALDF